MKVLSTSGNDVARVCQAATDDGHRFEFAERAPRDGQWEVMLSTLVGCPVRCVMCDAGGGYEGRLTRDELLAQLDWLVRERFPSGHVPGRFDVQLTRMGDPAFNEAVLELLRLLPTRYDAPGLSVLVSTVAPSSTSAWFEALLEVKRAHFARGGLRLQFSIHATSEVERRRLVPVKCWSFDEMAAYGRRFHAAGDEKVALRFAVASGLTLDAAALRSVFDPSVFAVHLTPLNATRAAMAAGLVDEVVPDAQHVARQLEAQGFETRVEVEDAQLDDAGASCGMHLGEGRNGPLRPRRTLQRA